MSEKRKYMSYMKNVLLLIKTYQKYLGIPPYQMDVYGFKLDIFLLWNGLNSNRLHRNVSFACILPH